jgi:cytochrome c peroxidase
MTLSSRPSRVALRFAIVSCLACAVACGGGSDDGKATAKKDAGKAGKGAGKAGAKDEGGKAEDKADDDDGAKAEGGAEGGADDGGAAAAWAWTLPRGLVVPPAVPEDNAMSVAKVELGHQLFMDKRLSVDGTRSCYSCHQNELGNADGRPKALGPGDKPLPRNSPTIWNVGLLTSFYWDGRSPNLEAQGVAALKGGNMGLGDALETKSAEIGALPEYKDVFAKVFGLGADEKVTSMHVAKALSAYERTLLCGDTAYDKGELSEAAERGKQLFLGKAACFGCHTGDNLSDGRFHITGIGVDPKKEDGDVGRFKVSQNEAEKFAFRTPTLRNVARTAPYFHDGSVKTLKEAVKTMAGGGKPRDGLTLDQMLRDVKLTDAEIDDLVAFLESLDCPGTLEEIGDQKAEGIEPPKG